MAAAIDDDFRAYEALMERLMGSYKSRIFSMCKAAEMTPPQFWALKSIQEMDRTKMSPLADHLGLSLGAASTLVDRLVTRGLVERTTDAQDRRAVHVSPSAKGRQVLEEVMNARTALVRQIFERLPDAVRPQLLTGIQALVDAWESLPPVDVPATKFCALDD